MSSSPISRSEALCLDLETILGAPVLLADEDAGTYYRLRELVRETIKPTDTIEAIWVRDITDLTWEALRYRRWKSAYHRFAEAEGAAEIYYQANGNTPEARAVVTALAAGSLGARADFEKTMKGAGYDKNVLAAAAFCVSRQQFEFLERMIAQVESRRDAIIREVERRREAVARRLRDIVDTADAEVIETDPGTPKTTEASSSEPNGKHADLAGEAPTAGHPVDDQVDDLDQAGNGANASRPWYEGQF